MQLSYKTVQLFQITITNQQMKAIPTLHKTTSIREVLKLSVNITHRTNPFIYAPLHP